MSEKEWNPAKLLEISGSYWKSCVLHAAVKLDIFSLIGDEQLASGDISKKLTADVRGVATLLDALAAMNLLHKDGSRYANTPASSSFLSRSSPNYIGHIISHHHNLMASWACLDRAVVTGRPIRARATEHDEQFRESFLMGMFNLAMMIAPRVVDFVDLSDRRHLLDLGGGPATYAIHFCLNNSQLKATVYDLPATKKFALETIERFGLSDRIDFSAGNYLEEGIRGTYDVAWLSHILHAEGPEDCEKIISKVVSALGPGGLIVVHDFILNDSMDGPLFPALFSINMLLGTHSGRAYSERQIMDMLSSAGVKEIQRSSFRGPNDSGIIQGIVK